MATRRRGMIGKYGSKAKFAIQKGTYNKAVKSGATHRQAYAAASRAGGGSGGG